MVFTLLVCVGTREDLSLNHILLLDGGYIGVGVNWVALLCMMSALGR